eukprot:2798905-Rhodomonas_salina.1
MCIRDRGEGEGEGEGERGIDAGAAGAERRLLLSLPLLSSSLLPLPPLPLLHPAAFPSAGPGEQGGRRGREREERGRVEAEERGGGACGCARSLPHWPPRLPQ